MLNFRHFDWPVFCSGSCKILCFPSQHSHLFRLWFVLRYFEHHMFLVLRIFSHLVYPVERFLILNSLQQFQIILMNSVLLPKYSYFQSAQTSWPFLATWYWWPFQDSLAFFKENSVLSFNFCILGLIYHLSFFVCLMLWN